MQQVPSSYLDAVSNTAGIVEDGELWLPQLHLRGVVVRMRLVLALKLLKEGIVVSPRETAREELPKCVIIIV